LSRLLHNPAPVGEYGDFLTKGEVMAKLEEIEIKVTRIDPQKDLHSIIYNSVIDAFMSLLGFALLIIYTLKLSN